MDSKRIRVRVPATSANLGSGFDCAGIAFDLYNVFEFELIDTGLEILGCEPEFANEDNLAYVAYKRVCDEIGVSPSVRITIVESDIPFSRGLGSSATLICAGAYSANKLHNSPLSELEVFEICTEIEGHPDNVAPALFGSLCVSFVDGRKPYVGRFPISEKIHFTAIIPSFKVATVSARSVLPQKIDRGDAVYNMSRVALLPRAFESGDFDLLSAVTKDRLHEDYRKKLFKNVSEIEKIAYELGAVSFNISGAGSTCLVISSIPLEKELNARLKDKENSWMAREMRICKDGVKEV